MTDDDALTPEIIAEEEEFNPFVEGRRITSSQMEVFKLWSKGVMYYKIEKQLGLKKGYVKYAVYKGKWFSELWEAYYGAANRELFREIISGDKTLIENVKAIGAGKRRDDKSTMAAVRLLEIRTQLGDRPMLNKRGNVNIQTNIIGGNTTINLGALKGAMWLLTCRRRSWVSSSEAE